MSSNVRQRVPYAFKIPNKILNAQKKKEKKKVEEPVIVEKCEKPKSKMDLDCSRDSDDSIPPPSKRERVEVDKGFEFPLVSREWLQYVLAAKDLKEGSHRCMLMKLFYQDAYNHELNNIELHHLVRHGEERWVTRFINECVLSEGHERFWKGFVLYTSIWLYKNKDIQEVINFRMAFNNNNKQMKKEDFVDIFLSCAHSNPRRDAEIYTTLCIIYPSMSSKVVNKALSAVMKRKEDPACLELFTRAICSHPTSVNFKRDDGSTLFRKFIHSCFTINLQELDPYIENPMGISKRRLDMAQDDFVNLSMRPASRLFNNMSSIKGEQSPLQVFINNPEDVEIKHNLELFQTYFFAYFRIGLFDLSKGYHMIAWNRYFDDRYYHEDNSWIFEQEKISTEIDWKTEWDYLNKAPEADATKPHIYTHAFKMLSKFFEFFKLSDKAGLMKKYGQDEFVQYFAVALTHLDEYDKFDKLYDYFSAQYPEGNVHLCLNINAMLIAAKRQNLKKVVNFWLKIVEHCIEMEMVEDLKMNEHMFKSPRFVGVSNIADIATKILRNCIYFQAVKEGTDGFLKYGMLLLFMAKENWDKFVPFNMIEIVLNSVPKEKIEMLLKANFADMKELSNSKIWKHIYSNFPDTHKTFFENGTEAKKLFANKRCELPLPQTLLGMYHENHPVISCFKQ